MPILRSAKVRNGTFRHSATQRRDTSADERTIEFLTGASEAEARADAHADDGNDARRMVGRKPGVHEDIDEHPDIVSAEPQEGLLEAVTVKWYDPGKGFGFVTREHGGGDVLIPAGPIEKAGHERLEPGQRLVVGFMKVGKGVLVSDVYHAISAGSGDRPDVDLFSGDRLKSEGDDRVRVVFKKTGRRAPVTGTVKWWNPIKGFGFIHPDDGGKDVFVHITAVEAAGMGGLEQDQRVRFEVEDSSEAATRVRPLD